MAYSQFTFSQLHKQFQIKQSVEPFLPAIAPHLPSAWLQDTLAHAATLPFNTEKARSEYLVTPVLLELHRLYHESFTLFSGETLDAAEELGLNGECDFIISQTPKLYFVQTPIICIVEAKREDMEKGVVQCAAQLVGAQKMNEQDGLQIPVLHGCVTIGVQWQFIQLTQERELKICPQLFYLENLPELLGAWVAILNQYFTHHPSK